MCTIIHGHFRAFKRKNHGVTSQTFTVAEIAKLDHCGFLKKDKSKHFHTLNQGYLNYRYAKT